MKARQIILFLLQISTFSVFIGRAWQHLYWDAPFRTLFWDEKLLSGFVKRFSDLSWEAYVTSPVVDQNIVLLIKISGFIYLISAFYTLFIRRLPRSFDWILLLGASNLIFLAFLYSKEHFYNIGQFFEYSLQFGSPIFLFFWLRDQATETYQTQFVFILKIAIALTFTCHGLYAVGYYPVPGHFLEMAMNILEMEEVMARKFLLAAGISDFILSIGIFLPWRWARFFLAYAILWGICTTLARIWANFNLEWLDYVLMQWLHESIYRVPHFLIPMLVFYFYWKEE